MKIWSLNECKKTNWWESFDFKSWIDVLVLHSFSDAFEIEWKMWELSKSSK